MERQFNNGDFEKLLRDNANQYRMYPSEKVWKGIHSTLHTRRRWYGLTALIMFLVTGSVVSFIIFKDKPAHNNLAQQKIIGEQKTDDLKNSSPVSKAQVPFTPAINKPVVAPVTTSLISDINVPYLNITDPISPADHGVVISSSNERLNEVVVAESISTDISSKTEYTNGVTETQLPILINSVENKKVSSIETQDVKDALIEKNIAEQIQVADTEKKMNELISALASQNATLSKPKKQSKVTAQVYFTPTVSYRKLSENKKVYSGSGYIYVPVIDLNSVVNHKPAMGLEFGIEGRYHLSDRLSLKAGFQFNINRYDIKAYAHPTEIATVALSSGFGVDSLATLSNYRNYNSIGTNWLENLYFQAGIPVGIELILSDKKDFQWGVSGSIQPTYVIGDKAYVISSDYKNYAKFPDLMRRWNISTGFGTFVSYSTGRIKWQAGPHVRYQHLSSFVNELTVKEKLFSVGLKVGATLNKKK